MKKFITGILAIVYLLMVSGFSMEKHYCMGSLAGIDFYSNDTNEQCGKCGMIESGNACCHDEHSFVKLSDTHKSVYNNISLEAPVMEFTPIQFYSTVILPFKEELPLQSNYSPPDDTGPSACILNCVFRL